MNNSNELPKTTKQFAVEAEMESELKKINKTLADTKILMDAVFDQSPIPLAVVQVLNAVLIAVNPACQKILGLDKELVGKSLMQIDVDWKTFTSDGKEISPENLPLARVLRGESISKEVMRIERKDGSSRWVEVLGSPIYDTEGKLMAAQIAFPDITERRQAEETIKEKIVELEKINRLIVGRELRMVDLKKELNLEKSKNHPADEKK